MKLKGLYWIGYAIRIEENVLEEREDVERTDALIERPDAFGPADLNRLALNKTRVDE